MKMVAFTRHSLKREKLFSPRDSMYLSNCDYFKIPNAVNVRHLLLIICSLACTLSWLMFFSVPCESDQGCMQTTMMNDCTSYIALFTCAQLRFPAVIHEVLRADIVIVCALVEFPLKKEDERRMVEEKKRELNTQQLPNKSFFYPGFVYVCASSFNRLIHSGS